MYVDSESCFVVFDFLQILYVCFTLLNYTLLYHQSLLFLFQLTQLFPSRSLLYISRILKIQLFISRFKWYRGTTTSAFSTVLFEQRNHEVLLHWHDFQVRTWLDPVTEVIQIKPIAITLVATGRLERIEK